MSARRVAPFVNILVPRFKRCCCTLYKAGGRVLVPRSTAPLGGYTSLLGTYTVPNLGTVRTLKSNPSRAQRNPSPAPQGYYCSGPVSAWMVVKTQDGLDEHTVVLSSKKPTMPSFTMILPRFKRTPTLTQAAGQHCNLQSERPSCILRFTIRKPSASLTVRNGAKRHRSPTHSIDRDTHRQTQTDSQALQATYSLSASSHSPSQPMANARSARSSGSSLFHRSRTWWMLSANRIAAFT